MGTAFGVLPWLGNPRFHPSDVRRREEARVRAIQRALKQPPPGPMQIIAEEVAAKHGLSSWKEIRSPRRSRPLVAAKHETWWRCREETEHSLPSIARFFGFDHTTIIHGIRAHESRMKSIG